MELRSKLIRLAHSKPELRPALLPLIKEACGYMADDSDGEGKEGCGYTADDDGLMAGKQMHNVKPEKGKGTSITTKADKQRDPYARSLAQGQYQPKVMNPDKRQKLRDKFKD